MAEGLVLIRFGLQRISQRFALKSAEFEIRGSRGRLLNRRCLEVGDDSALVRASDRMTHFGYEDRTGADILSTRSRECC